MDILDVKVLANAGGVNPHQCAKVLAELAASEGVGLNIAVVEGDDLMPKVNWGKMINHYNCAPPVRGDT